MVNDLWAHSRTNSPLGWCCTRWSLGGGPSAGRAPQRRLGQLQLHTVARHAETEGGPAWSPNGKSLSYTLVVGGVGQIMTRELGASVSAQLTRMKEDTFKSFWWPDGKFVYFHSGGSLWAVGAAGSSPEKVLEGVAMAALHSDGRTFAFIRSGKLWVGPDPRFETAPPRELGKAPYDGTGFGTARGISWMPDSRRLVVDGTEDAQTSLWVLDTANARRRKILVSPFLSISPSRFAGRKALAICGRHLRCGDTQGLRWAPDGTRLQFRLEAQTMMLNASGRLALPVDDKPKESGNGVWPPDGQWVAYWRRIERNQQLAKRQPGSAAEPVALRTWTPED